MTPKLSLVIVNYRSADVLEDCLRSVHVATKESVEVILVDNSPIERENPKIGGVKSAEQVLEWSGLAGKYFPQVTNIGYTWAANLGARHAAGDYICFVNPDTVLEAHSLDRMVQWLVQHPRSVVGPRELNSNGEITTTIFPFVTRRYIWGANLLYKFPWPRSLQPWVSWLIPPFRYAKKSRTANRPMRVPVLSGSCLMMARRTWHDVGEWNTDLTYFGLESEWFKRASLAGVSAWYIPDSVIYHEHGFSIDRSHDGHVRREADNNRRWHAKQLGVIAVVVLVVMLWIEYRLRPVRK